MDVARRTTGGRALREPAWIVLMLASVATSFLVQQEPALTDMLLIGAMLALLAGRDPVIVPNSGILVLCFAVFAVSHVAASVWQGDASLLMRHLGARLYMLLIVFAGAVYGRRSDDAALIHIAWAFFVAAAIGSIIIVLARLGLMPDSPSYFRDMWMTRMRGTFKDPNVMGPFMATGLVFSVVLLATAGRKYRLLLLTGMALMLISIMLSASRGALIVLLLSLVILMLIGAGRRSNVKLSARGAALLVGTALCAAIGVWLLQGGAFEFVFNRMSVQSYDAHRLAAQQEGLMLALSQPWGHGVGTAIEKFAGGAGVPGEDPHNVYIRIAYEGGVAALLAYLGLLALGLRNARISYRRSNSRIRATFSAALFAIIAAHMANGLTIDSTHWRHLYLVLGLATGLALPSAASRVTGTSPAQ